MDSINICSYVNRTNLFSSSANEALWEQESQKLGNYSTRKNLSVSWQKLLYALGLHGKSQQ